MGDFIALGVTYSSTHWCRRGSSVKPPPLAFIGRLTLDNLSTHNKSLRPPPESLHMQILDWEVFFVMLI